MLVQITKEVRSRGLHVDDQVHFTLQCVSDTYDVKLVVVALCGDFQLTPTSDFISLLTSVIIEIDRK